MYSASEILTALQGMSPSELQSLSKAVQRRFSIPVEETKEIDTYDFWQYYRPGGRNVILHECGPNYIKVICALRKYRNLSLRETKELVDHHLSTYVKENCEPSEAYRIRDEMETLGAVVSLEAGYIFDPLPNGYSYD